MTQKNYNTIVGGLFVLDALFHLWLGITRTPVFFGDVPWPMWINWVAFIVALALGYYGIKHGRK